MPLPVEQALAKFKPKCLSVDVLVPCYRVDVDILQVMVESIRWVAFDQRGLKSHVHVRSAGVKIIMWLMLCS